MRITNNFVDLNLNIQTPAEYNNWKKKVLEEDDHNVVCIDKRTQIVCLNPTHDVDMLLNYSKYINDHYSEWKSFGYFDIGMVPFKLWPDFGQTEKFIELQDMYMRIITYYNIDCYTFQSTSFFDPKPRSIVKDVWIYRDGMLNLMHKMKHEFTDNIDFKCDSIEDATLTNFLTGINGMLKAIVYGDSKNEPT